MHYHLTMDLVQRSTPKVLEILKKYNAHATFYIVGSHVEGNESIVKQIVAEGHELGDHSYSHPLLTKKSADEVYQEVHKTSDLIAKSKRRFATNEFTSAIWWV